VKDVLRTRLAQGYRTMRYPVGPAPELPARFLGRPVVNSTACPKECRACQDACPTGAITIGRGVDRVSLDTGLCLFCGACSAACRHQAISFSKEYRLAAAKREDLKVRDLRNTFPAALHEQAKKLFGSSLKLREVSAGGCNACEADTNVLNTLAWDLGRFGIQFVAAPRHADGILITGPVPRNMHQALIRTYQAVPAPKVVIAVGTCAISGGPYVGHPETSDTQGLPPIDLYIPGCPPHPLTILAGLLMFLGKKA
jgi:Ni,Fe-hydrogenase III small subunit/ferredoxin